MTRKRKIGLIMLCIIAVLIMTTSFSYAYFTSNVIGNDTAKQTVITSGNLAITFSDGLEVSKSDMIPGDTVTKTFSVENTGTGELKYDIYFSEICNLFVDNNDLVYTLTSTNNGYSVSEPTPVPTTPTKLVDSQTIETGVTQDYTLTITFVNADYDQSNEMGAYFSTKLNINDYKGALHCSKYNNSVKYYVSDSEVQEIPNNIGYLYSTSNCTNNTTITWDNTNWNYAVDYDSSTADSVCSIYFTPKVSKLTIDPNGGTWNTYTASQEYNLAYKEIKEIPAPTKEGYTFVNWTVNGNETSLNNQELTMGYEESSLTANYSINQYTLTINPDGGDYSGNREITQDYGTSTEIGTPSKRGYTFKGWTTPSIGILSNETYEFGAGNETITAQWEANDYAYIAYHYKQSVDGESYTLVDATADHNTYIGKFGAQVTPPVRTDSFITGFTAPAPQTITLDVDVTNVNETPTVNVVNYNYSRNKYILTTNPNNGTSSSSEEMYYEATKTITNPSKTGYNFTGWDKDNDSTTLVDNTLTMGVGNTTISATYTPITYTITYNLDGGTNNSSNPSSYTVESDTITIANPSKTGYTFNGWTGDNTTITKGSTGNKTYTANWTANTYYVAYNANGGSGTVTKTTCTYGSKCTLQSNSFTRSEYEFLGWSASSSATTATYTGGQAVAASTANSNLYTSNGGTKTLYAVWKSNPYTVMLNNQSATSAGTTSVTVSYGSAMPSITVPTKTGYTFNGYYSSTGGSGTKYYNASGTSAINWDKTSNATLYAYWTAKKNTVTLNNQSATSAGTTSVTATYGSAMPSITVPTKTDYIFGGYYTSTGGSGTKYYTASGTSARKWDKTRNTTLYAYWEDNGPRVDWSFERSTFAFILRGNKYDGLDDGGSKRFKKGDKIYLYPSVVADSNKIQMYKITDRGTGTYTATSIGTTYHCIIITINSDDPNVTYWFSQYTYDTLSYWSDDKEHYLYTKDIWPGTSVVAGAPIAILEVKNYDEYKVPSISGSTKTISSFESTYEYDDFFD